MKKSILTITLVAVICAGCTTQNEDANKIQWKPISQSPDNMFAKDPLFAGKDNVYVASIPLDKLESVPHIVARLLPINRYSFLEELRAQTPQHFDSEGSFILYVQLPEVKASKKLSYVFSKDDGSVVAKSELASNSTLAEGKQALWAIKRGDSMVDVESGSIFQNATQDSAFASTPLSQSVASGDVYVRSLIKSQSGTFNAGGYRLDILMDETIVNSITFDIE